MTDYVFKQSLSKHNRSNIGTEGGPPPFLPFGQVRTFFLVGGLSQHRLFFIILRLCVVLCQTIYSDSAAFHGSMKDKEFNNFAVTPKIEAIKS